MKSNWEDAPDYLRSKKKPGPWRMVVILGVGSAITWGVIALFAKPIVIDVNQLMQAIHIGGKPLFSQQPAQAYSEPESSISLPQAFDPQPQVHAPTERGADQVARQTSFSDSNYTPKQLTNTYTAQPQATNQVAMAPQRAERSQPPRQERTSKRIDSWDDRTSYWASWLSINNRIDGASVCDNHKRGSFDYRECRKAAKQHFHEECRAWTKRYSSDRKDNSERMRLRYCSASSSFNPMG